MVPELWYLNYWDCSWLFRSIGIGYFDPLGLGVPDCLLIGVLGVLGASESVHDSVQQIKVQPVDAFVSFLFLTNFTSLPDQYTHDGI